MLLIPPYQISKYPHLKLQDLSLMAVCVWVRVCVCVNAHVWCSINSSGDRPLMLPLLPNPNTKGGGKGRLGQREEQNEQEL